MSDINPYDSSSVPDVAGAGVPPESSPTGKTYISAAGRVYILTVLFTLTGIWHLVMIGMNLAAVVADVDNWGNVQIGDMLYPSFWIAFTAVGLLFLPIYLATIIVFCMWVHRSNANARSLGAEKMDFTPGWCVGWFFIPIMNLFKPYQAVREIYQASDPDRGAQDWRVSPVTNVLGLWWALWIVTNLLGNIESRMARFDDPQMFTASCWLGIVGSALGILLCWTATKVVRSIQARLQHKAIKLGAAMEFSE